LKRIDFISTFDFPLGIQIGKAGKVSNVDIDRNIRDSKYALRALFSCDPDSEITVDIPFGTAERNIKCFIGLNYCRARSNGKDFSLVNTGTIGYTKDEYGIGNMLALAFEGGSTGASDCELAYMSGVHSYCYSLIFNNPTSGSNDVMKRALEVNTPLLVLPTAGAHDGDLPPEGDLIKVEGEIIPTTFRRSGDRCEIRFYENGGKGENIKVKLSPMPSRSVLKVDLRLRERGRLKPEGDIVNLEVAPWEIVTLILPRERA